MIGKANAAPLLQQIERGEQSFVCTRRPFGAHIVVFRSTHENCIVTTRPTRTKRAVWYRIVRNEWKERNLSSHNDGRYIAVK